MNRQELAEFLQKENLLDFKLNFRDQNDALIQQLEVNSTILATTIPYFANLFQSGMKEATLAETNVKDMDPKHFCDLFDFAFFGRFNISDSNCSALYEKASFFGLDEIQKRSYDWMLKNISQMNFQQILDLACSHGLDALKKACETWISKHTKDFDDNELKSLIKHYQLNLIVKFDDIQAQISAKFYKNQDLSTDAELVQKLQSLESIDLRAHDWKPEQINQLLSLCPNVKTLFSSSQEISIAKSLPDLESLWLDIRDKPDLSRLAGLQNLKHLLISENKSPQSLDTLVNFPSLKVLQINVKTITDLSVLSKLPQLETLILYGLNERNLQSPPKLENLTTLVLSSDEPDT